MHPAMDMPNLHAFRTVAECGSFSEAAARLHLSQPAVSKRIAQLEAYLAATLFDRVGRGIALTEAGHALLPHARAMATALDGAEQCVRDLAGSVAGRLRVGTSHHIGLHRLPTLLSRFSRRYPEVKLDITFLDSEKAHAAVASGAIELAIATLAPDNPAELHSRQIWVDRLDVLVAHDHELAHEPAVALADLAHHDAVLPGLDTYTGRLVADCFRTAGLTAAVALTTNYLETLRMMASVGLGWTVLPHTMRDASLRKLPVQEMKLSRRLGYLHHKERSLSRAATALIAELELARDA